MASREECIAYWRRNRRKYPWPLTYAELSAIEDKKECEIEKWRLREERASKCFIIDTNTNYPKGSWEEYFQKLEANKRMVKMEEMEDLALEAQMEAMQVLVCWLASQDAQHQEGSDIQPSKGFWC